MSPIRVEEKVSKTVCGGVADTAASSAAIGAIAGGKKGAALGVAEFNRMDLASVPLLRLMQQIQGAYKIGV